MVKYIDWSKHLRLGNWLFLYAGINSILKNSGHKLELPDYFLWKYLETPPTINNDSSFEELFHFRQTNYTEEEGQYLKDFFKNNQKIININLGSHLQSELWFKEDIDYIKYKLKINQEEIDRVKNKYKEFFTKKTIGIGIRRGDFVGSNCFYQIPESWYEETLIKYFPNYKDYNIIIFSDDINWCKTYYQGKNFLFAEENDTYRHDAGFKYYHQDPMEQFILGILCDNFIGGSSTFTWWQMWYVKNFNNGKVIHSGKNLNGECLQKFYNPDYYPNDWILNEI